MPCGFVSCAYSVYKMHKFFMQILDESVNIQMEEEDFKVAAAWIYEQLSKGHLSNFSALLIGKTEDEVKEIFKADIMRFLNLQHVQKLDVSIPVLMCLLFLRCLN